MYALHTAQDVEDLANAFGMEMYGHRTSDGGFEAKIALPAHKTPLWSRTYVVRYQSWNDRWFAVDGVEISRRYVSSYLAAAYQNPKGLPSSWVRTVDAQRESAVNVYTCRMCDATGKRVDPTMRDLVGTDGTGRTLCRWCDSRGEVRRSACMDGPPEVGRTDPRQTYIRTEFR